MDSQASTTNLLKSTSSVHDITLEKPPFGSRFLTDETEVWTQNAWDHVPPPDDQDEIIAASLLRQRGAPVSDPEKQKYHERPARHWDNFYRMNSSNFFKNRKWLHNEFRELISATEPEAGPVTIVEVGCGAGNSVFPLLTENRNPDLSLRAYDYSRHAVKLVQENPLYTSPPIGTIEAAVWDLTSETLPDSVTPASVDIVIMVFVFSALHPDEWTQAVSNVHKMLKPGGLVVFRDYGRYDMAQLRFKGGRLLEDNFYIRGDKTRVYFFEMDELSLLFTGLRAKSQQELLPVVTEVIEDDSENSTATPPPITTADRKVTEEDCTVTPPLTEAREENPLAIAAVDVREPHIHPNLVSTSLPALFTAEQLGIDRRLLLNRKRQVKMYRVWMQAKFRKLNNTMSN
ncbi:methyltransferase [Mycena pura]|uniref:tRNA N(3)-methylcytidine methyltransferase n=1 Tax=Mycena pura TaxID=153505 RepID=A0AAD7E6R6_9AGAR|nr:methyltransferase [Mycena pura]